MRASCQLCHLDDNEAQLLLCDSCDKGFHTYCFKPTMDNIPEGNWYCFICIGKAMGEVVCIVCGKKSTLHLLRCDFCLLSFHGDCLDPPLVKIPRGRWHCNHCAQILKCSPSKKNSSILAGVTRKADSPQHHTSFQQIVQHPIKIFPNQPPSQRPTSQQQIQSEIASSLNEAVFTGASDSKESPTFQKPCDSTQHRDNRDAQINKQTQITLDESDHQPSISVTTDKTMLERSSVRLQDQQNSKQVLNEHQILSHSPTSQPRESFSCKPTSMQNCIANDAAVKHSSSTTRQHIQEQQKQSQTHTAKTCSPATSSTPTSTSTSSSTVAATSNNSHKTVQRLRSCKQLLSELKSHAAGWPFLQPVNLKAFPQYKKIIKTPMDFSLIERRLTAALNVACADRGNGAASVTQAHNRFAADVLLVFKNCLTFNEDDSEVGKAGKTLEKHFRKRWKEIFGRDVDEETKSV